MATKASVPVERQSHFQTASPANDAAWQFKRSRPAPAEKTVTARIGLAEENSVKKDIEQPAAGA